MDINEDLWGVGGWVGGKKAVQMRCWSLFLLVGVLVGGWKGGGLNELL